VSEIYPSVRTSIRNSVLQALYARPGAWLSTHDLLDLVEEAETSSILARILSDMAATGRLAKGPKTQNSNGQACNTWGLSPEWRGRVAVENTWQDHTGQETAERQTTMASLTPPVASLGTEPQPLPPESYEDEAARLPASVAPPDPAPAFTLWEDASAVISDALPFISGATSKTTPSVHETEILCVHLPERWLPELRLRLLGYDGGADPVITLRVNTEGHGAFMTLSTHGKIAFDPGELDFLPSIGTALCQFIDALYPYGVKPGAK
jgi:hypothetical protein